MHFNESGDYTENCAKGIKMTVATVEVSAEEASSSSASSSMMVPGYHIYLKDATMKVLFLHVIRNICIWNTILFPFIRTHIQHNYALFKLQAQQDGDPVAIEGSIMNFTTNYATENAQSTTTHLVNKSIKLP